MCSLMRPGQIPVPPCRRPSSSRCRSISSSINVLASALSGSPPSRSGTISVMKWCSMGTERRRIAGSGISGMTNSARISSSDLPPVPADGPLKASVSSPSAPEVEFAPFALRRLMPFRRRRSIGCAGDASASRPIDSGLASKRGPSTRRLTGISARPWRRPWSAQARSGRSP